MSDGTKFARICRTAPEAHDAATHAWVLSKMLLAEGKRVRITAGEDDEPITVKQRNFFHGPVLGQISEQVRVEGVRYAMGIWKEHLRELFLPVVWEQHRKPFVIDRKTGKWRPSRGATPRRVRQSTEDLGIKGYSELIDKTIAYAAMEWGVEFVFIEADREAVRYVERPKKRKVPLLTDEVKA